MDLVIGSVCRLGSRRLYTAVYALLYSPIFFRSSFPLLVHADTWVSLV